MTGTKPQKFQNVILSMFCWSSKSLWLKVELVYEERKMQGCHVGACLHNYLYIKTR
jgi:hypothetical protein